MRAPRAPQHTPRRTSSVTAPLRRGTAPRTSDVERRGYSWVARHRNRATWGTPGGVVWRIATRARVREMTGLRAYSQLPAHAGVRAGDRRPGPSKICMPGSHMAPGGRQAPPSHPRHFCIAASHTPPLDVGSHTLQKRHSVVFTKPTLILPRPATCARDKHLERLRLSR
jgi:hypothetical protein